MYILVTYLVQFMYSMRELLAVVDVCSSDGPCQHGATCRNDGHGGYSCSCEAGFSGTNCERDLRDCRHHQLSCLHDGTCQVTVTCSR